MNYDDPDGETIQIAALRAPSTGKKTGSLLVNPGGPGASGYDFVKDAAGTHFSQSVRDSLRPGGLRSPRRETLRPGDLHD